MRPNWKPISDAPKSGRVMVWDGKVAHFAVRAASPGFDGWIIEDSHQPLANVTHYADDPEGPAFIEAAA